MYRLPPVAAHLFLIIQDDIIKQSINCFWSYRLRFGTNWLRECPILRSSGWLLHFSDTISLNKTCIFIIYKIYLKEKKMKWDVGPLWFYFAEKKGGTDSHSNLVKLLWGRYSSARRLRDAFDGTQSCASGSSGFSSGPRSPPAAIPHAWYAPEPSRVSLGVSELPAGCCQTHGVPARNLERG